MKWQVSAEDEGLKLIAFLHKKCPHLSKKALKRLLDSRACLVDGRLETYGTPRVRAGATVELRKVPRRDLIVDTLWENEDVRVVKKPVGFACEPRYFPKMLLVHRLDKDTSGVLLLAKHKAAFEALSAQFKARTVCKKYLAVVAGRVAQEGGCIDMPLRKKGHIQGQTLYGRHSCGKRAVTHWVRLEQHEDRALLSCQPITGRTHQLRVHLKEIGHPILGDALYGRETFASHAPSRLMLHAYRISFRLPSGEEISIEAPATDFNSHSSNACK